MSSSFKKIKIISGLLLIVLLTCSMLYVPSTAYADTIECADGTVRDVTESDTANDNVANLCATSGGIKPGATIQPSPAVRPPTTANPDGVQYVKNDCSPKGGDQLNQNNCGIIKYLVLFIKFLSGLVGIVVVISIIIGGIQYSASGGDPNGVNAAKKRIFNAILALAVYAFIFAILQFLIPGGVFAP